MQCNHARENSITSVGFVTSLKPLFQMHEIGSLQLHLVLYIDSTYIHTRTLMTLTHLHRQTDWQTDKQPIIWRPFILQLILRFMLMESMLFQCSSLAIVTSINVVDNITAFTTYIICYQRYIENFHIYIFTYYHYAYHDPLTLMCKLFHYQFSLLA